MDEGIMRLLVAMVTVAVGVSAGGQEDSTAASGVGEDRAPVEASNCSSGLQPGQYRCSISFEQLRPRSRGDCAVACRPAPGIRCGGTLYNGSQVAFHLPVDCKRKTANYKLAVILSIFGGMLGMDRFYLGYPALGLLKLLSCGGMGFWHLADIILVSLQVLGPSDGSYYQTYDISSRLIDNDTHYFSEF